MKKKIEWVIAAILILCVFIVPRLFKIGVVQTASMENTLSAGNYTYINRLDYQYDRGDIIAFKHDGIIICKRLIAKGGDTVSIKAGNVYVNNALLAEPYITISGDSMKEMTIPPGMYFVLGDNRPYSFDSRDMGPIKREEVIGKVAFCIYPFKRL